MKFDDSPLLQLEINEDDERRQLSFDSNRGKPAQNRPFAFVCQSLDSCRIALPRLAPRRLTWVSDFQVNKVLAHEVAIVEKTVAAGPSKSLKVRRIRLLRTEPYRPVGKITRNMPLAPTPLPPIHLSTTSNVGSNAPNAMVCEEPAFDHNHIFPVCVRWGGTQHSKVLAAANKLLLLQDRVFSESVLYLAKL
jgi:hypothetical protein